MATACSPDKIVAALHEQSEIITDIVRENIKQNDRLALRMVPDGGTVRRHSNQDSVIYGEARQAPVAYNQLDHSTKALVRDGEFVGRTLQGTSGIFAADMNDIADNACHGQVTIDFAQGFRIRRTTDYGLDVGTPIKCARELDRQGEAHIRGYFRGFQEQFTRWGLDNFSDNLINLMIQYAEANTAVLGANQFAVTTNGWQAPPLHRVSIHFLQDYRDHKVATMRGRGVSVPEDYMLEVEMPVNDWIDAVRADQIARNGTGTSYNTEWLKDDEGPMRGRRFGVYGGIKCYFNEEPIRGYFKKVGVDGSGNDVFNFVRVLPWINTQDEEGGIIAGVNHQYREDTIYVDGVAYAMVNLIPSIDARSFKRWGLIKPLKPIGGSNAGVNYEVRVIDGPGLACNDFNDKFKLAARHEFRFKAMYPEFSGFIACLSGRRAGYTLDVVARNYVAGPTKPSTGEVFRTETVDDCSTAECAQCDKIAGDGGTCIDAGEATTAVVGLAPAGAVTVGFFGDAFTLKIGVERTTSSEGAVSVDYATAASDDEITSTSGTLEWAAGDNATKFIEIPVLTTADDNDSFTLTLTNPVGATLRTGADVTTVTINSLV